MTSSRITRGTKFDRWCLWTPDADQSWQLLAWHESALAPALHAPYSRWSLFGAWLWYSAPFI